MNIEYISTAFKYYKLIYNIHYWRSRLYRVFLHSAKSPLHSAKALPSVALGKVRSANFFSAKGLCRVFFIGALRKIKKNLPSAWGGTWQNIFGRCGAGH